MRLDQLLVTLIGLAAIGGVAWFFWLKRSPGVRLPIGADGYQEGLIVVKGGYTPDTIRVRAGRPVRLVFRREETAACSERVLLPDFDRSAALPTGEPVAIEFIPKEPGAHQFTCQMGMLRGQIVVEAA
jgi:Uncharacterized protein conserved in bacteria